jgi:CheY-like chemotaxis protein
MDMRMPVMGGEEATRLIKKLHPDLPVIAVTASSIISQRSRFEEFCDAMLNKPVSRGDLAKMLKCYLPQKADWIPTAVPHPMGWTADSSITYSASPELLNLIRDEMDSAWLTLCETPSMGETEAFAYRLLELAERFESPDLQRYAKQLLNQIDQFDVEGMSKTLSSLPKLVDKITPGA